MTVSFHYDDCACAFQDKNGSGFLFMHYFPANHVHWKPTGLFDEKPTSAWRVEDWLKDENGKHWSRIWYGVMDDFGDLVEIEIEELP